MKISFKKIFLRGTQIFLGSFLLLLLWIFLLKFIPIYWTPTMFFRSTEAYFDGKDSRIYYEWASYEDISAHIKVAVVASEDQRFPTHGGIDWKAVESVMEENKKRKAKGMSIRGASTISQQVAKNVFLWQGKGWTRYPRKALEVPLTYLIEWIWGKERILEVYLNIIEVGPQTFGVQGAARRYFKKDAETLTQSEAALIAAVLPNPRKYLITNPNRVAIFRQNHVLRQMRLLGGFNYLKDL